MKAEGKARGRLWAMGCLHNVLGLGGSQAAARVGAVSCSWSSASAWGEGKALPGNHGVTHWEHKPRAQKAPWGRVSPGGGGGGPGPGRGLP